MCGICGIARFDQKPVDEALIRKMCRSFQWRGPDDEGIYIYHDKNISVGLGHRRLSIIDLSNAGHQPMCSNDKSLWITYNGEIYNFKTLQAGLKNHRFKSNTDTEVILHLYEEKATSAVHCFNGMFAFALWDEKNKRLWLCRDRIGVKPLVYFWNQKKFAFASEIKALLCDPSIPKELDYDALALYLAFSYIPAPYTIFKGIRKLEPGHSLILEKDELRIENYWMPDTSYDVEISSKNREEQIKIYKDRLYRCLDDAVKIRMIADVPLGAFLSGGIDSSIIVALMAQHSSASVKTFSIGFTDAQIFDETHYAQEVAEIYNTDHHVFKISSKDMIDVLPQVLSVFDEPFSDSSAIPTFIVSRQTRQHVTVALSGDGGDELFAGYRYYLGEYIYEKYMRIPTFLRQGLFERLLNKFPDARDNKILEYIRRAKKFVKGTKGSFPQRILALKEIFSHDIRQKIFKKNNMGDIALQWVQRYLNKYPNDSLNSMLYADIKDSLPGDMLTKVDWMSMKNSLEVRVPFLDYRVVELAFQIPGDFKLYMGKPKYILKETFKHLLPKSLHRRKKAGFEVPISKWLRNDLNFLISEYLSLERIRNQGIFEYKEIVPLIKNHMEHRTDTSWMLWNLIVFGYWSQRAVGSDQ